MRSLRGRDSDDGDGYGGDDDHDGYGDDGDGYDDDDDGYGDIDSDCDHIARNDNEDCDYCNDIDDIGMEILYTQRIFPVSMIIQMM